MRFTLTTRNVLSYLAEQKICRSDDLRQDPLDSVESRLGKNFNLLVHLNSTQPPQHLLVKQESRNRSGQVMGDLGREWQLYQQLTQLPEWQILQAWLPEAIHFDADRAILILNYLLDYQDLETFYVETNQFPIEIAARVGLSLATLHRATWQNSAFVAWLHSLPESSEPAANPAAEFYQEMSELTPELWCKVPREGIQFYRLYQRDAKLAAAIADLGQANRICCLTHHDLKFNNILLAIHPTDPIAEAGELGLSALATTPPLLPPRIRLIDWEKWDWGDPSFDLGTLVAGYLKLWLKSLPLSREIEIETVLQWAGLPLDRLQPSLQALLQAYQQAFPEIGQDGNFLQRVVQQAGLVLCKSVQTRLYYQEPFDNVSIAMLQVGRTLLCQPQSSLPTLFGIVAKEE